MFRKVSRSGLRVNILTVLYRSRSSSALLSSRLGNSGVKVLSPSMRIDEMIMNPVFSSRVIRLSRSCTRFSTGRRQSS